MIGVGVVTPTYGHMTAPSIARALSARAHKEAHTRSVALATEWKPHDGLRPSTALYAQTKQGWDVLGDLHQLLSDRRQSANPNGVEVLARGAHVLAISANRAS